MAGVSYLGLWPRPLLSSISDGVCPNEGDPPSDVGGETKEQPLVGLSLKDAIYFIWKVKNWSFDIDFTINIDWEYVYDDASPNATGTLGVDRTFSVILDAREEFSDLINSENEIPCLFSRWSSLQEDLQDARMIPEIYDGGIDISFIALDNGISDYSASNIIKPENLSGSGFTYDFSLPTSITFSDQNISTNFGVSMTTFPQELSDLFDTFPAGFGTPLTATVSGTMTVSEEETWAY
jgi:hypothetical protein